MSDQGVAWLRDRVQARKAAAEAATEGPWDWVQEGRGDKVTLVSGAWRGHAAGGWLEVLPVKGSGPDAADAAHIALNDPRDVIARCEAELAILDAFQANDSDVPLHLSSDTRKHGEWDGLRLAVRLLARAYRYQEGWEKHWGEQVSRRGA